MKFRLALTLATLIVVARASHAQAPGDLPSWIAVDSGGRTVTLTLVAAPSTAGGSPALNGEREGSIQVVVPQNWTVRWSWRNADSTAPHSLVVMMEREKLPEQGGRAALTNAMSRSVTTGLPVGRTDETTFVAEESGWYWVLCGVPGHALNGEWIGLRIDPAATGVSVKRKADVGKN